MQVANAQPDAQDMIGARKLARHCAHNEGAASVQLTAGTLTVARWEKAISLHLQSNDEPAPATIAAIHQAFNVTALPTTHHDAKGWIIAWNGCWLDAPTPTTRRSQACS